MDSGKIIMDEDKAILKNEAAFMMEAEIYNKPSLYQRANCCSKLTFSWAYPVMKRTKKE
jgi:hypothetical protein